METVHRLLSCKVFWHVYAKIPRHTGQNTIIKGDLECILTRLLLKSKTVTENEQTQKRIPHNSEEDPVRFINFSRFEALSEKQQQVRDSLYPVTWRKYSVSIR